MFARDVVNGGTLLANVLGTALVATGLLGKALLAMAWTRAGLLVPAFAAVLLVFWLLSGMVASKADPNPKRSLWGLIWLPAGVLAIPVLLAAGYFIQTRRVALAPVHAPAPDDPLPAVAGMARGQVVGEDGGMGSTAPLPRGAQGEPLPMNARRVFIGAALAGLATGLFSALYGLLGSSELAKVIEPLFFPLQLLGLMVAGGLLAVAIYPKANPWLAGFGLLVAVLATTIASAVFIWDLEGWPMWLVLEYWFVVCTLWWLLGFAASNKGGAKLLDMAIAGPIAGGLTAWLISLGGSFLPKYFEGSLFVILPGALWAFTFGAVLLGLDRLRRLASPTVLETTRRDAAENTDGTPAKW